MLNPLRALTLGGLLLFSMLGHAAPAAPDALRIGYQKGSVSMVLAKSHQLLEQRYPQTHISWIEFPVGPQMLEALNVGSIDIGSTGDIPPIFAQAAGADLVYIGAEPPKPKAEVILVAQGSPIHNVAELKGKKVAFQKGSSSHNLLLRALQLAGLKFSDIQLGLPCSRRCARRLPAGQCRRMGHLGSVLLRRAAAGRRPGTH